jgi:menaquinone-specific isochorismate synthase
VKFFWRSKDNVAPPKGAQFFFRSFSQGEVLHPDELLSALPPPSEPLTYRERTDLPDRTGWSQIITETLDYKALKKVVLARETRLYLTESPDPFRLLAALEKKATGASLYCVQIDATTAFLGATPERLFHRKTDQITVESLAGTRKKGPTAKQDLINSEKERREHQFVQQHIQNALDPFCMSPTLFSPMQVHSTSTVVHLFSQSKNRVFPTTTHDQLLQALHPTPALCGTPKEMALHWIEANEPFQRGFYGGIIGWETPDEIDCHVAIRSCLIRGNEARIYVGTGIVQGSDWSQEWEELEAKFSLYTDLFVCGP